MYGHHCYGIVWIESVSITWVLCCERRFFIHGCVSHIGSGHDVPTCCAPRNTKIFPSHALFRGLAPRSRCHKSIRPINPFLRLAAGPIEAKPRGVSRLLHIHTPISARPQFGPPLCSPQSQTERPSLRNFSSLYFATAVDCCSDDRLVYRPRNRASFKIIEPLQGFNIRHSLHWLNLATARARVASMQELASALPWCKQSRLRRSNPDRDTQ